MTFVGDLRIPVRLALAFGLVCVGLAVVSLIALRVVATLSEDTTTLTERDAEALVHVAVLGENLDAVAHRVVRHLYVGAGDVAAQDEAAAEVRERLEESLQHEQRLAPLAQSAEAKRVLAEYRDAFAALSEATERALELSRAETVRGVTEHAASREAYTAGVYPALERADEAHDDLEVAFRAQAEAQEQAAKDTASSGRLTILVAGALAILAALGSGWLLARTITAPLRLVLERLQLLASDCIAGLRGALEDLARGDLTTEVVPQTPPIERVTGDEIGAVSRTFNDIREATLASVEAYNAMRAQLTELIGSITATAGSLASASQQMASTSEETGRAVSEIATAVGDVAQGAEKQVRMIEIARESTEQTATAALQAREVAEQGVEAAAQASGAMEAVRESSEQLTSAMAELEERSERIGGIVETITGIAGQTNLLALNAAIEAARAGEQGKGFAVVAEEVRKLAEESQRAAASIADLVAEIQAETQRVATVVADGARRSAEGAMVVARARDAFTEIGTAVADITERVASIAQATTEVAAVAEQSSAGAEQVSASTEETTASTQQIAASAQELASTAEKLNRLVARFRLSA
jgi:methyl-accepting chemotaxis protein